MKNIFENAYFGKAYKTRDGRKAIYIKECFFCSTDVLLSYEGSSALHRVTENGQYWATPNSNSPDDIVSEWHEEINEEELDNLAEEYFLNTYNKGITDPNLDIINEKKYAVADFKAGYRKAKGE